jgi:hypothetical protein
MDFDTLSDFQLKQTCRALGISTRKFSRETILKQLKSTHVPSASRKRKRKDEKRSDDRIVLAVIVLQNWWRSQRKMRSEIHVSNDTDFVTLESITVKPFYLIEDTGHIYQFHPMNLAQYFMKEGNFVNPYTRKPLNQVELRRLDRMVDFYDATFVSLYEEQKRITIQRSQEREHIRVCQLLHQECTQMMLTAVRIIKRARPNTSEQTMFQIEHVIMPKFFDTFRQLFLFDQSFACESIKSIIKGLCDLWNDASSITTREGCYVLETMIGSLSQFVTTIIPMMPAMLPELQQLPSRVR